MPKLNKHLRKLVIKMVNTSVDKNGTINPTLVKRFTKSLKELSLSQSILALTDFSKGIKREISKTTLVIESPVQLSLRSQKQIARKLVTDHLSLVTRTQFVLNPSLLGGLRVKIGDTLIDDSVRDRMNQLKERIVNG